MAMEWTHTEPVTIDQMLSLRRMLSPLASMLIDLDKVDLSLGRGVGEGTRRCLWTKEGHRIDISVEYGTFIASQTKEPDPNRPTPEEPI